MLNRSPSAACVWWWIWTNSFSRETNDSANCPGSSSANSTGAIGRDTTMALCIMDPQNTIINCPSRIDAPYATSPNTSWAFPTTLRRMKMPKVALQPLVGFKGVFTKRLCWTIWAFLSLDLEKSRLPQIPRCFYFLMGDTSWPVTWPIEITPLVGRDTTDHKWEWHCGLLFLNGGHFVTSYYCTHPVPDRFPTRTRPPTWPTPLATLTLMPLGGPDDANIDALMDLLADSKEDPPFSTDFSWLDDEEVYGRVGH